MPYKPYRTHLFPTALMSNPKALSLFHHSTISITIIKHKEINAYTLSMPIIFGTHNKEGEHNLEM